MECWQSWHYIYNIGLEEKINLTWISELYLTYALVKTQ